MKLKKFIRDLFLFSAVIALILLGIHQIPGWGHLPSFSWSCLLFFVLFSIIVYQFGYKAAKSSNRNAFTVVSIGFLFYKMFLSVAFVFIYVKVQQPKDNLFLVPFFIIYFCYTIFETHVLIQLGKMRPDRPEKN